MSFVNEYVSEENIKKYNLEEVKLRFNPQMRVKGFPSHFRFYWVVDRDKDVFLMKVKVGRDADDANRVVWVLNWRGHEFIVQTDRSGEGSHYVHDSPFKIVWDFVNIKPEEIPEISKNELMDLLKNALSEFGKDGAVWQIENTLVELRF